MLLLYNALYVKALSKVLPKMNPFSDRIISHVLVHPLIFYLNFASNYYLNYLYYSVWNISIFGRHYINIFTLDCMQICTSIYLDLWMFRYF